ncbi:bacterial regulatory protein, LuxR family protein 3 [Achromobacter xylosoxidans A8]|uniref:Bacterial regulatory protein, LuxR family protein 3 n=1 Tax=Achromobacter xylosoxidans (strain A8) TaxID=762376 RepID=E3HWJ8_ACHXA|nr:LuxR C-terminal-related transcriptional regulator [Achromobacter xylosoxidans]ADP13907.1 bacterial regulatory protein, LuxR family protein 3 [Achromobacter xylosoxidans A8]
MQAPRPDLEAVLSSLTPRERQIVTYVAAGRPNKVIAIDLGISLRTVEAHRSRIFTKLQVRNAMQLACRLCEHGRSGASPVPGAADTDREHALIPMPLAGSASPSYVLHEAPGPEYGRCLASSASSSSSSFSYPGADPGRDTD